MRLSPARLFFEYTSDHSFSTRACKYKRVGNKRTPRHRPEKLGELWRCLIPMLSVEQDEMFQMHVTVATERKEVSKKRVRDWKMNSQ